MNAGPSSIVRLRPQVIKPGRANVQTTFQLATHLASRCDEDAASAVSQARRVILQWLREKLPEPIPHSAYDGEPFECDEHGQKIACIPVPQEGIWTVRLGQPDAPFKERPAVPGRFWTTDLALRTVEGQVFFAVRIQCASLEYAQRPITLTRPRVVLDLAEHFALREARDLDGRPWALRTFEDLKAFEAFLLDPARNMPAVLLTQPDRTRVHMGVSEYLLNAERLAKSMQGFGYVITMPRDLGYHWTDLVGKPWSAFLGAVRTYMPGLDYDRDTPAMHPLVVTEKILFWRYGDEDGQFEREEAFERFLVEKARVHAATKRMDWRGCVFVPEARPLHALLSRRQTVDFSQQRESYEQQISALQEQLKETQEQEQIAMDLASAAEAERNYYKEENRRLRAHNESLRATLVNRPNETESGLCALPTNYDDIPEWVSSNLIGRLELHPRAARALRKATYEDVPRVCKGLYLLAREYRNMRLGYDGAKKAWEDGLRNLGLEFSGAITSSRAGEQGDTYFVNYPPHSNEQFLMEFHLRHGNSRDQQHCLRIYFFWHEDSQQVIVGWLPSHLDTRHS